MKMKMEKQFKVIIEDEDMSESQKHEEAEKEMHQRQIPDW